MEPPSQPARAASRRGSPLLRHARRLLLFLATLYVVVVLLVDLNQEWLLFTGRITQGPPPAHAPEGMRLVRLRTARGTPLTALFGAALDAAGRPRADAARCPTILHFYGTGTCLRTDGWELARCRRLGCNVLAPDYAGYGWSGGTPSERGCYAAADAVYEYALQCPGIDRRRLVSCGTSLGGAVAIDLASRRPVAALATFSTFTSMGEMAQLAYPLLPAALLRHSFRSEQKISRVHCPIFLSHGTADRLIPFPMRDRLARAAGGPATLFTVEGGGHGDFYDLGGQRLMDAFDRFLVPLRDPSPACRRGG